MRVLSICLVSLIIGLFSIDAFATTTTYTDYATWQAAIGGSPSFSVNFNGFTQDTPIPPSINFGPFTVQSSGGVKVDVPPYDSNDAVYGNGTPNLSLFVWGTTDVATLSFSSAIQAWFGDFWCSGNGSPLQMTLVSVSGNTELTVPGTGSTQNSFGFTTDKLVTELILHNTANDGFNLDNVAGKWAAVPIPGAVWLFGPGLVGLAAIRRKFKI